MDDFYRICVWILFAVGFGVLYFIIKLLSCMFCGKVEQNYTTTHRFPLTYDDLVLPSSSIVSINRPVESLTVPPTYKDAATLPPTYDAATQLPPTYEIATTKL